MTIRSALQRDPVMEKINSVPVVSTLGIEIDGVTDDIVRVRTPHEEKYDSVFDTFHGGMLMTVADISAVRRFIKAGNTLNTTEVDLFDADGVRVAVAQVCYIRVNSLQRIEETATRKIRKNNQKQVKPLTEPEVKRPELLTPAFLVSRNTRPGRPLSSVGPAFHTEERRSLVRI